MAGAPCALPPALGSSDGRSPPQSSASPGHELGQFVGDYDGVAWNAQGYFMSRAAGHAAKRQHAQCLLRRRDFLIISEAHVTKGAKLAYTDLPGTSSWWSIGTAARAGVGIIAKNSFLERFRHSEPEWLEPEPGRFAVLRLCGAEGAMDVAACYMPTGVARALHPAVGDPGRSDPCPHEEALRAQREGLCRRIPALLRPDRALMVLAGDFNFVVSPADRWNKVSGVHAGASDAAESEHWRRALPLSALYELYQSEPTHEGPVSLARLDRVYVNQPVADQLDKRVFSVALPWTGCSQHRPLAFGRQSRPPRAPLDKPIAEEVIQDERWPIQVAAEFLSLTEQTPQELDPMVRLRRLKVAMKIVSARLHEERSSAASTLSPPSALGVTMAALRRLERHCFTDLPATCARYPALRRLLPDGLLRHAPHVCLARLREHAIALAREEVRESLQRLHDDLPSLEPGVLAQRRSQVMLQLKRVAPGRSSALAAVLEPDGELRTDGPGMAASLKRHWRGTFSARRLDRHRRLEWFRDDAARVGGLFGAVCPLLADAAAWRLRRSDVRKAVSLTSSSSPGPDGIPYSAWKRLGPLAVDVLFSAAEELSTEHGRDSLLTAFPADENGDTSFNEAVMVFIPKKVAHEVNGIRCHKPDEVRPLSIVNTDNRLMANAVRLRVEPLLAQAISPEQRGFLPGRSLLQNVVEVDGEMRAASLQSERPGAVFFDFAAAFPSLAHGYLLDVLEHLQLPLQLRAFVANLYFGNGCKIAAAGGLHEGFSIRAGIRQGCPLSPLLFALCGDLLLRRVRHSLPGDMLRAYADDLALVSQVVLVSAAVLVPMFFDFASISGLALNLAKTVFVPLGDASTDQFRCDLERHFPGWGGACVRWWAEYLGFVLGPGRGTRAWLKALQQYERRAELWAQLGLGLHFTAVAYNVYVASLLGFLLQLEVLPEEWESAEAVALCRMVPGPAKWALPADLHVLRRHFGMPHEFTDMHDLSRAARFRVFHREATPTGGLAVPAAVRRLNALYADSDFIYRGGVWRQWYLHSYYHNLAASVVELRQLGISISTVEADLGSAAARPRTRGQERRLAHGVQRAARAALSRVLRRCPEARFRAKLERWRLPLFPRIRATRAVRVLGRLRRLVPPRVVAALLRTWFNGWCTSRRFQGRGPCIFGCALGEDSVDHYVRCSCLHRHGEDRLRLPRTLSFEHRGVAFLLLDTSALLPDAVLTRRALLLAAAYRLHCRLRRGRPLVDAEVLRRALDQAVKESALGHAGAMRHLDSIWAVAGSVS